MHSVDVQQSMQWFICRLFTHKSLWPLEDFVAAAIVVLICLHRPDEVAKVLKKISSAVVEKPIVSHCLCMRLSLLRR